MFFKPLPGRECFHPFYGRGANTANARHISQYNKINHSARQAPPSVSLHQGCFDKQDAHDRGKTGETAHCGSDRARVFIHPVDVGHFVAEDHLETLDDINHRSVSPCSDWKGSFKPSLNWESNIVNNIVPKVLSDRVWLTTFWFVCHLQTQHFAFLSGKTIQSCSSLAAEMTPFLLQAAASRQTQSCTVGCERRQPVKVKGAAPVKIDATIMALNVAQSFFFCWIDIKTEHRQKEL